MNNTELIDFLRGIPLFAANTTQQLSRLLEQSELRSAARGTLIFDQGSPADGLILIVKGRVSLLKKTRAGEMQIGLRRAGDYCGEAGLSAAPLQPSAARADEDCRLICIPGVSFKELFFSQPELRKCLDEYLRFSAIQRSLAANPVWETTPSRFIDELAHLCEVELFRAGQVLYRQGSEAEKFYQLDSGLIKLTRWSGRTEEIVGLLREGDLFGDQDWLKRRERPFDAVCLTDCQVIAISGANFEFVAQRCPELRAALAERPPVEKPPALLQGYQVLIKQELAARQELSGQSSTEHSAAIEMPATGGRLKRLFKPWAQRAPFALVEQCQGRTSGAACLLMVANYYGITLPLKKVHSLVRTDFRASRLSSLSAAAEQLGFSTRAFQARPEDLDSLPLPSIVLWRSKRFVVLYRVSASSVYLADPAAGLQQLSRAAFAQGWQGLTMTCEPAVVFTPQEQIASGAALWRFGRPFGAQMLEILLAALLLAVFTLAAPLAVQLTVDRIWTYANAALLNVLLGGLLLVLLLSAFTRLLRDYLTLHLAARLQLSLLAALSRSLWAAPLLSQQRQRVGALLNRFTGSGRLRDRLISGTLLLLLDAAVLTAALALLAFYSMDLALLTMVSAAALLLALIPWQRKAQQLSAQQQAAHDEAQSRLCDLLSSAPLLKQIGAEQSSRWHWHSALTAELNSDFRLSRSCLYRQVGSELLLGVGLLLLLWLGVQSALQGALSLGELLAVGLLLGLLGGAFRRLLAGSSAWQQTLPELKRLLDWCTSKAEFPLSDKAPEQITLSSLRGEIELRNLYFRYGPPDSPWVLSGINLRIKPGETIALMGRSGTGKSTLAKLLCGHFDEFQGEILIDGHDIRTLNLAQLRRLIRYVPQESLLMDGSIRENISLFDPDESRERVKAAANLADLSSLVAGLPEGYETKVGRGGLPLSGGEKQRLALAQALYAVPEALILDEAMSSLDGEAEQALRDRLAGMLQKRTAVIISSRISTVRQADRIIVLEQGRISEQGTAAELLQSSGYYRYLHDNQANF